MANDERRHDEQIAGGKAVNYPPIPDVPDPQAVAKRLQESLNAKKFTVPEPRTGVGTPDSHALAAGAELGGDTGDVGTPRIGLGDSPGGTGGTKTEFDAAPPLTEKNSPPEKRPHKAA